MKHRKFSTTCLLLLAGAAVAAASVTQPLPWFEGSSGLAFALRKLPVNASLLHTAAHPDDEDNPLLVALSRGRGVRTGLLTLTRGDGGQNEIGPELFEALGILRTEELASMHRYDGAQQFFSDAIDFGYSFSTEETFAKWGREGILEQVVRVIRTFRPQVILSLPRTGEGGGQHHQASALLTEEAFRAAADAERFPHHLEEGLRPWQALKLYERQRWSDDPEQKEEIENALHMHTGIFDPLFGRTWAQIGFESRSLHRCQGMGQIVPVAGPYVSLWKLVDAAVEVPESEKDLFDGIDTSLYSIAAPAGEASGGLLAALDRIQGWADGAQRAFDPALPVAAAPALAGGLEEVRRLRREVAGGTLPDAAKYEIDFALEGKERDFAEALRLARQIEVNVFSRDGLVVPGQSFEVEVHVVNGGNLELALEGVSLQLPEGWSQERLLEEDEDPPADTVEPGRTQTRRYRVTVARDAPPTRPHWTRPDATVDRYQADPRYQIRPWADPEVRAVVAYVSGGARDEIVRPAGFRYTGPWVGGEQRHHVMVVPAVSLRAEPEISVLPLERTDEGFEVRVRALYEGLEPADGEVVLTLPAGWTMEPRRQSFRFERPGESRSAIFRVRPAGDAAAGSYRIHAFGEFAGKVYTEGYQVIDYHHVRRRHLYHPARVSVQLVDVRVADGLRVGYVEGVGDHVAEALQELGVDYELLEEDDLAFGDLSRYDTIVLGVRAFLAREDLRAYNARLLEWVAGGGVLIVQYNKFEFNHRGREHSPYAPYPVKVGRGRVTDENAPVQVLAPDHPVFHFPNRIGPADWEGWVQERGLYYLDGEERDERYRDLLSMEDPFEYNAGEKPGSLVEAEVGEGVWIYLGLGLWRQLPAGTPGSYRLLANLISLPKTR